MVENTFQGGGNVVLRVCGLHFYIRFFTLVEENTCGVTDDNRNAPWEIRWLGSSFGVNIPRYKSPLFLKKGTCSFALEHRKISFCNNVDLTEIILVVGVWKLCLLFGKRVSKKTKDKHKPTHDCVHIILITIVISAWDFTCHHFLAFIG